LRVEREDVQATLLFALLHDIGHFPLSHMFEDLQGLGSDSGDPVLTDDELFFDMLNGGNLATSKIAGAIARELEGGPSLASVIEEAYGGETLTSLAEIAGCAFENRRPARAIHRMLAGLVSSAGDVDKMAYLVADSHFTGVPYGKGLDIWGYLRTLRVPEDFLDNDQGSYPVIAIDERGLKAIESIIQARYSMLERVYWLDRNRAIMALYKDTLCGLFDPANGNPLTFSEYFSETFWSSDSEATKFLARKAPNSEIAKLAKGRRGAPWELLSIERDDPGSAELWAALTLVETHASAVRPAQVADQLARDIELVLSKISGKSLSRGTIMVDIPWKARDEIRPEEIIILSERRGPYSAPAKILTEASETVGQLGGEFLNGAKKCRVFIRPAEYSHLETTGKLKIALIETRAALARHVGLD
jgi:HD superfamily phosphohydrolase